MKSKQGTLHCCVQKMGFVVVKTFAGIFLLDERKLQDNYGHIS